MEKEDINFISSFSKFICKGIINEKSIFDGLFKEKFG